MPRVTIFMVAAIIALTSCTTTTTKTTKQSYQPSTGKYAMIEDCYLNADKLRSDMIDLYLRNGKDLASAEAANKDYFSILDNAKKACMKKSEEEKAYLREYWYTKSIKDWCDMTQKCPPTLPELVYECRQKGTCGSSSSLLDPGGLLNPIHIRVVP